jgi:hypothetical protein
MRTPHGFLAGLVGGLLLDHEALIILLVGLALGAAGGFAAREVAGAYRWARRRLSGEAPAPPYTIAREVRPARRGRVDRRPW